MHQHKYSKYICIPSVNLNVTGFMEMPIIQNHPLIISVLN